MKQFSLVLLILITVVACKKKEKPKPNPIKDPVENPDKKPIETNSKYRNIEKDAVDKTSLNLSPRNINLANGKSFTLNVHEAFDIHVAAEGMRRVRFFAKSPDKRIFVSDMHGLSDNERGKIYILEDFNQTTKQFGKKTLWMEKLRNPNSIAFYTDKNGTEYLYVALTQKLVRYKYSHGETAPSSEEEVLAEYPDYGLSYKYGGWHLTRSIAFHEDKLYISVGSSCNSCEEKLEEPSRATIMVMNPDGSDQKLFASGLRNAVDIQWVEGDLFATNMQGDHLGSERPEDNFFKIENGKHYGWPYCYEVQGEIFEDTTTQWLRKNMKCQDVPNAYTGLDARSSPLGFAYFDHNFKEKSLQNYFLISLHGSGFVSMRKGYAIVRTKAGSKPEALIDGFLPVEGDRVGRPCGILPYDNRSFFFSDDLAGVVYYVSMK